MGIGDWAQSPIPIKKYISLNIILFIENKIHINYIFNDIK